jgi:hypothetical protein
MHKIDQRLRRRQRRRHGVDDASPPASALASVSGPPPPPPPPPLAVDPEAHARPGKLALRPIGAAELTALLAPSERVLLTKVDTEGAELAVLGALEPLLPRTEHLIVEVAPGWWELYRNRTARSGRGGERHTTRGDGHAPLTSEVAASMQLRANGAQQLSRLLTPQSKGGWGFAAALTSNGRHFTDAATFHEFIVHMGSNGYWHQRSASRGRTPDCVRRPSRRRCESSVENVHVDRGRVVFSRRRHGGKGAAHHLQTAAIVGAAVTMRAAMTPSRSSAIGHDERSPRWPHDKEGWRLSLVESRIENATRTAERFRSLFGPIEEKRARVACALLGLRTLDTDTCAHPSPDPRVHGPGAIEYNAAGQNR